MEERISMCYCSFDPRIELAPLLYSTLRAATRMSNPLETPKRHLSTSKKVFYILYFNILDGNFVENGLEFKESGGKGQVYTEILEGSQSAAEFMSNMERLQPRDFVLQHERLEYFCSKKFKKQYEYRPTRTLDDFVVPTALQDWVSGSLVCPRPERPRSLYLVGPSRWGKTEWARVLGAHIYANAMLNLDNWDDDAGYMVLDDIRWDCLGPAKKQLIGAQSEITLTDKYRKKQTMAWGKPCIILVNDDMDVYDTCEERVWLKENAVYHSLTNKLY